MRFWGARIESSCNAGVGIDQRLGWVLERADNGMEKLVANTLKRVPPGEGPLLAWPVACGSVVAEKTRAMAFENGILRVEVPNVGWRKEMQTIAAQYLAILNRYCSENVKRIEFVIAGERSSERK